MIRNRLGTIVAIAGGLIAALFASFLLSGPETDPAVPERGVALSSADAEVMVVFIGSSRCSASRQERFQGVVRQVNQELRRRTEEVGIAYSAIGVSIDWSVEDGFDYLRAEDDFDEVVVGRNWWNTGVERFILNDFPGRAATPQFVVLRRAIRSGDTGLDIQPSQLLTRRTGVSEITGWLERGVDLPELALEPEAVRSGT